MTNNDEISKKLDDEYRKNLQLIRPFIIKLVDVNSISRCRIWLEKMDKMEIRNNNDKRIRNDYLTELRRQMHTGVLEFPFSAEPPDGELEDFASQPNLLNCESDSWSDCSGGTKTATEIVSEFEDEDKFEDSSKFSENQITKASETSNTTPAVQSESEKIINELKTKNKMLKDALDKCLLEMRQLKQNENIKLLQELQKKDKEWEQKMQELERSIKFSYETILSGLSGDKISIAEKNIKEQYKKALDKAMEENNIKHEIALKNLEIKLMTENEHRINQMLEDVNKKWEEKLNDMQISLIKSYEEKIKEISEENEIILKNKDEEILGMQNLIEEQNDKIQDAVNNASQTSQSNNEKELAKKISYLQNYVIKIEKLFKKYEAKYYQKVAFLKRDINMKENAMQIHIMTQNATLVSQCRSENQKEMEMVIDKLENKYRKLLDEQMTEIRNCKYLCQKDIT